MKVHKMFCIDADLAVKLEGENASALVNKLLKDYLSCKDIESMTREQAEKRLAYLELKKKHRLEMEALEKEQLGN